MKELHSFKKIPGPDPNYRDICFSGARNDVSQLSKSFPVVDMHSKVKGAYCLGVFQNGKDPSTLLGGIIVRNTLVMYDREHKQIGFWKTNCSELWERLRISDFPPPVPPIAEGKNSTEALEPAVAPSESHHNLHPEELQIAQIKMGISFNISYLDMKPHITELLGIIAHELNVQASQVHLLNLTSLGNGSLSWWAITPNTSTNYMSNTTAMSIVSRLAENRMQLPSTFGSYKLVNWSVESPTKGNWWEQHYMVVALVALITLLLGLSSFAIFLIWRNKQQSVHIYKPVAEAVPEQELQPLNQIQTT